ncbi:MAG: septum formation protein Maf [Cyclobacteriaceae bacterium]
MNSTQPLILASNSPRRQELLKQAGFLFDVVVKDFDEDFPASLNAREVAEYLAVQKNRFYRLFLENEIIITADTTVICDEQVLNKPENVDQAKTMLRLLSNNSHQVVSGVCISSPDQEVHFSDTTEVRFAKLTDEEIDFYISRFKPYDKAGSYGIQEWIGLARIESIVGSYFTVMGLPTHRVYEELTQRFGLTASF